MSVTFRCEHCGAEDSVRDAMAGRRIRCPQCEEFGLVPAVEAPAAGASETSPSEESSPLEAAGHTAADSPPVAADAGASSGDAPPLISPGALHDGGSAEPPDDGESPPVKFGDLERTTEGEMDMTPMVDVTFLLLIFFMVTAAFSMQKSIPIPKPDQTDEPSTVTQDVEEESPDIVTVQIDEIGTFVVMTVDWEKEAPGEIDLLARLREAREGGPGGIVPDTLMIKAHTEAHHGRVVMALDAGSATGFEKQQVMTVDDDF